MAGKGRTENLRSFAPGHSGNPSGRPRVAVNAAKARAIIDGYASMSAEEFGEAAKAADMGGKIFAKLMASAASGNMTAMSTLLAYWIGKPKEETSTGDDDAKAEAARLVAEDKEAVQDLLRRAKSRLSG